MELHGGDNARIQAIIDHALHGEISEEQAMELQRIGGTEAVVCALLAAAGRIAAQDARIADLQSQLNRTPSPDPATPSAMIPVYQKPTTRKRRKKPGAKIGHPGSRRPVPERIDERKEHRLDRCPDCDGPLQRCNRTRTRIIEDIPETIEPIVTEYTIHRDYCPACSKHVEPIVPDALPKAIIGHHLVALTAWFHYGLGVTIGQVASILSHHLHAKLTPGGLMAVWARTAAILVGWYEQIGVEARQSSHLHCDETGWRVAGKTHWLWCFTTSDVCYYMIDRSRGSPALHAFLPNRFAGC